MDNAAANKNHVQCPTWLDQGGWSTTSTQGLSMNLHTNPQTLSLGSTSVQRPLFSHLDPPNQSCMSNLNSLSSRNNSLLKAPNMNSIFSSNSIFQNPAITTASHGMAFVPQASYSSPELTATNQAKAIPPTALSQQNQSPQPCVVQNLPSQQANYKMFQTPLPGHGLPHVFQDQSFGVSLCGPNVNMSQATFGGQNSNSRFTNTSTSMEHHQWVPSSSGGAVPDVAGNAGKEPLQEKSLPSSTEGDKRRSSILNQRAHLLKQLENIDKLLESIPSDDSNEGDPSNIDDHSPVAANCSSPSVCDRQSLPASPGSSVGSKVTDKNGNESDAGGNSDYAPPSEVSFSDSQSEYEDDADPKDSPSRSYALRPTNDAVKKEENSDDTWSEEDNDAFSKKTFEQKKKKSGGVEIQTKEKCYNGKKNYCLFCTKPMTKMARHLTRVHSDRVEVAVAFQYPANSMERKKIWQKLINDGNFKHNKTVLKTGKGQLAVRVRPSNPYKPTDFVHCIHCHGLLKKKSMHIHMKNCKEKVKKEDDSQEVRKRIVSQCALLTKNCNWISAEFKNLLGAMLYDDVSETVMEDQIMLQFGEQMFNDYSRDAKKQEYVRQNLRHVARLLLEAQKSTPMESLEDFFKPANFKHVVSAVRTLAGYDPEKKQYARASLALKLGYHLKKICGIIQRNADSHGDTKVVESCKIFLSIYRKKWTKCVTSCALANMKDMKRRRAKKLPSVQDVKRLYYHLEKVHHAAEKKLRENNNSENFAALAKAVLGRTILFNRRFPEEVASLSLAAFKSRMRSDVCDEMDVSVSKLERKLCGLFSRVNIRGNCGRLVPIILTPSLESSIELLIDVRRACGILTSNPYVFSRQFALTPFRGSMCIQTQAKECGAEDPTTLTVLNIRKHFATVLQLLNLDDDEVRQVLGPGADIQVLRQINDTMCDDTIMETEGPLQLYQQHQGATGSNIPDTMKKSHREGMHSKAKLPWSETEVRAIEKHLMNFIKRHKIPQKDDCVQCLDAEPHALRKRSWRGVKDYVRNRITTLKRQAGSSKEKSKCAPSSGRNATSRPQSGDKETKNIPSAGPSSKSGPSTSQKRKGSNLHPKTKPKWDEAEVRAVEKHLMPFIEQHKLPHKEDCIRCLEAEQQALRKRNWKGIKDYVRNRITSLQRPSRVPKASSKTRGQPRQRKSQSSGENLMEGLQHPNEQQPAPEHQNVVSSWSFGSSNPFQPQTFATINYNMIAPSKTGRSKEKGGVQPQAEEHLAADNQNVVSNCSFGSFNHFQPQTYAAATNYSMSAPPAPGPSKEKEGRLQHPGELQATPDHQNVVSSCSFGSSNLFQPPTFAAATNYNVSAPPTPGSSKEKAPTELHKKSKHTWNEAEVRAVEKHLMNFITKQKLPQKADCVRCLEAEPDALASRSWKGTKDYVRNRIITLQRQSGVSRTPSKTKRTPQDKQQKSSGRYHQL